MLLNANTDESTPVVPEDDIAGVAAAGVADVVAADVVAADAVVEDRDMACNCAKTDPGGGG